MAYPASELPTTPAPFPTMSQLKVHNPLLGDVSALAAAWKDDGYWFFRDVLDRAAVGRLRAAFVEELERQGVIDAPGSASTERSVRYNGASLERYPYRMDPLAERAPWREFVAEPAVHAFFTRLFRDEPFWLPIAEYRATPPARDRNRSRFDAIHQDGPFSPGMPFRICWIPLARIDETIGGVVLAEGLTEHVNRHPLLAGTNTAIPVDALPADSWRRATYEAGDLLLMNPWTPHSGLANLSEWFRLSIDLRVMARSDECPIVGTLEAISCAALSVRDGTRTVGLRIDDSTYVRNEVGKKLTPEEMLACFKPGTPIIVAYKDDLATVIRPPH